ncbi:MAG: hypothetical protein K2W85_03440 [Phycisphaerales bacterium]|nr:hypothetical protein [Phycisphaerales bacterium]
MIKRTILAVACMGLFAGAAAGQVPALVNGNMETPDPFLQGFGILKPLGWRMYNFVEYRTVGDGMLPAPQVRSGTRSVRLPGGEGRPFGEFGGVHSEDQLDLNNINSPRNWPNYNFNPGNAAVGRPIKAKCWFMIPANDPMVKSRFGIKVNFLNDPGVDGTNFGVFYFKEVLAIDPEAAVPFPGTTVVTVSTPSGPQQGIHTNGQWLPLEVTVSQQTDFPSPIADPPSSFERARMNMLALRFDIFPDGGTPAPFSQGTVWVDDLELFQEAAAPACPADFDGMGGVTVQDIFGFLNAWFASDPRADFDGTGGVTVQDIFAFLNAWFAGCP